jgi:hypothetical protein
LQFLSVAFSDEKPGEMRGWNFLRELLLAGLELDATVGPRMLHVTRA